MPETRSDFEGPATGVLLLSGEGTVLAQSGPATLLAAHGRAAQGRAMGHADLPAYFRAENGDDLLALVRTAANADVDGPLMARVFAEHSGSPDPILLTLHHVAAGLVVGVLSDGTNAPAGAEYAVKALRMVWDGLVEGVAVATLDASGHLEKITGCNGAFASMFGLGPDDVVGQPLTPFLAPLNGAVFDKRVADEVVGEGRAVSDLTMAQRGTSGERSLLGWELAPVRAQDRRVLGVIAVVREASHAQRPILWKRSDLDPSSGLPNQVHFLSRLERSVERAAQARAYTFAVIGLEMRGLRAVERRLGTLVASTALDALVRRLGQRLRPTDLVARTGDRRLAVLLDHFAPWGALEDVLERIRLVTDAPYTIAGERLTMSAIGAPGPIWSGDRPPVGAHDVLGHLDAAVARAKAEHSTPEPQEGVNGEVGEVSNAVQRAQLSLRYLPVVAPEDGRIVGLEALVQWSRPERPVVTGRSFIHHAEQQGLIGPIGQWVWTEALRHMREWDATLAPGQVPPVHINLSLSEFWHPDLVGDLGRRAAEAMVAPSRIRLEIPESAVARRTVAANVILEALAHAGFEPWLDRFGEGGTRLRELESLPFRHAKLTPAMAWSANGDADRPHAMLGSLLSLGHALGWRLTVCGVERREQADALGMLDGDWAQGFFYHGLLDVSQAAASLRQSSPEETHSTSQ